MTALVALLYGLIQGVTEYLPVSSSAHLILFPKVMGSPDYGLAFDVFLHIGTLLSTLIYFRKDWAALLHPREWKHSLTSTEGVTLKNLIIGTIPALLLGALLHGVIKEHLRGEGVVVITLAVGGVMLYLADRFSRGEREVNEVTWRDALGVGLFQCLALMPGMSRSGSTMSGARLLGLNRAAAARFSFLLSAPVTAAAIVFELRNFKELANQGEGWGVFLIAGFSSFVFGLLTIGGLLRVLRRVSFLGFAVYRVLLALFVYFTFRPF